MVKELGGGRMRRSAQSSLPRYLHMQLTVAGETMTLQLQRNTDIDTNIPFTFAGNKSRKVYIPDRQDIALYQDEMHGAAVSVTAKKEKNNAEYKVLEGTFNINRTYYVIHPENISIKKQSYENGVPHRTKKVKMPKGDDTTTEIPSNRFRAKKMDSADGDEAAKQRRRRDTTVESYSIEIVFVLDFTIYD
ncbi:hypothetical protein NP493_134g00002 [Ridgeia piscesae]|uniref:Uncharacterized protein n=1 Tax=Ridgeia piscesae TaxID=27915 RepID=A0AAD9UGD6_RIDPI|nr:hypothetical protein NP493_134g00002 [Ridgeia piscesae]